MKATGIVRRIDDLGRVVIPKEMRRVLHIAEGDQVEIYTENGGVVALKKYSSFGENTERLNAIAEVLADMTGCRVLVADGEAVCGEAGMGKSCHIGREIGKEVRKTAQERQVYRYAAGQKRLPVLQNETEGYAGVSVPLVSEGEVTGQVIVLLPVSGAVPDEKIVWTAKTASAVIEKLSEH